MSGQPSYYHLEAERKLKEAQLVVATAALAGAISGMVAAACSPEGRTLDAITDGLRRLEELEAREGPAAVDAAVAVRRAQLAR